MAKEKKRPSKAAKVAQKILNDSKLLAANRAIKNSAQGSEFRPNESLPKPADAIKPRPNKKRG